MQEDFAISPISQVVSSVALELEAVKTGIISSEFQFKVSENLQYDVDILNGMFKNRLDNNWKESSLNIYSSGESLSQMITKTLVMSAKELSENKAMEKVLVEGAPSALFGFSTRLSLENNGRLSALAIEEIMKDVANATIEDYKERLMENSWGIRSIMDAWLSIMKHCITILYGPSYQRSLRQAGIRKIIAPVHFLISGIAVLSSI